MRRFDDPKITCVFDKSHTMPSLRWQYHFTNCKKQYLAKNPESVVYHCRHYYLHVYLDGEQCKQHESEECPHHPLRIREREAERVRKEIQERERQMQMEEDEEEEEYNCEEVKSEDEGDQVSGHTSAVVPKPIFEITLKQRPHFVCTTMCDPRKRFKSSHTSTPPNTNDLPFTLKPQKVELLEECTPDKENIVPVECIKASKIPVVAAG